mgnify:CR=1 FL=1
MNQILVTEKIYVTPELKRKKKMYKLMFVISLFCMICLSTMYIYAEVDRNKESEVSNNILQNMFADSTIVDQEENALIVKITQDVSTNIQEFQQPIEEKSSSQSTQVQAKTYTAKDGKTYNYIGRVVIPKIGVDYAILDHWSDELLKVSICKFHGANPNEVGNLCLVGHNWRNKRFFSKVPTLEVGDIVQITDLNEKTIDYEVYDSPNRVMITCDWGKKQVATVKSDTQVRYRGGVKSPIVTDVKKKDEVIVLENEQNWKKILTKDGYIGYVKKNALKNEKTKNVTRDFTEPEYTSIKKDYTINMAWHNVTNSTANSGLQQRLADSKGLTTIVPTWFHVKDTEGNLESIASTDYVNYAHQAGLEVWAAIRDFDGGIGSNDESLQLLSYSSRRENLINQLIGAVMQVGIDGINVDFEKISKDCGVHYIQFIRELSVKCRQNGIVLSVDNYVPKGYNQQYNRKEQGVMADYVIIMGYDEHNGSSLEAGSVSSYEFVKEGIEETIKEVPAEKVINGIPFFTRLWSETPKTQEELNQEAGTEAADYPMKVTSEALGMSTARDKISQAGAETTLDETTGNNYATWEADGVTYEIWLEDATSIEPKLQLMKENKLAGTAAWALGQESSDIWDLILKYVN